MTVYRNLCNSRDCTFWLRKEEKYGIYNPARAELMQQLKNGVDLMAPLSIIPFIFHLMIPVPLELQLIFASDFTIHPLTPTKIDSIEANFTFTAKLGAHGKLPGNYLRGLVIICTVIVLIAPLFAVLERSMSNKAKIYHQYKDEVHGDVKKAYLYSANCEGKVSLTMVCHRVTIILTPTIHSSLCFIVQIEDEATVFQIRNEGNAEQRSSFHISCCQKKDEVDDEEVNYDEDSEPGIWRWRKLGFFTDKYELEIVVEDDNINSYPLIGMITPYYMQDK